MRIHLKHVVIACVCVVGVVMLRDGASSPGAKRARRHGVSTPHSPTPQLARFFNVMLRLVVPLPLAPRSAMPLLPLSQGLLGFKYPSFFHQSPNRHSQQAPSLPTARECAVLTCRHSSLVLSTLHNVAHRAPRHRSSVHFCSGHVGSVWG
jgi:hypothetical protein